MDQKYAFIQRIMEDRNIKKHNDLPIWIISGGLFSPSDYRSRKVKLLEHVSLHNLGAYVIYDENPLEHDLLGDWLQTDLGSWIIPKNLDTSAIFDWLYLGGWSLYSAKEEVDHSVFKRTDLFNPNDLWNMLQKNSINFILSSFHDNDPWIIGSNL